MSTNAGIHLEVGYRPPQDMIRLDGGLVRLRLSQPRRRANALG